MNRAMAALRHNQFKKIVAGGGFTDTFTRTSSSSLGTADSGQSWTQVTGVMGTDGTKGYVVTSASPALAWAETGLADATWQCTLTGTNGSTDYVTMIFRYVDASNYWGVDNEGIGANKIQVFKVVAGTQTSDVLFDGGTSASGDVIKIVTSGSSITGYKNNVLFANTSNATDSFNSTATKVGFMSYGTNWKIDDLTVT